jgi:outer membrane protein assembly factor BamD
MNKAFQLLLQTILVMVLAGCSLFGDRDKDEEREKARTLSETELYERVQLLLDEKNYDLAVRNLQLLESRFPFGNYAEQSQLEIIYAYYQSGDEDAAIAAAERFLRLHPRHPEADYAWYMKGLANYQLTPGLLSRFYDADTAAKDIHPANKSFREFQQFLRLYPDSRYAADAHIRMVYMKDVLARHELVVANYYIKRRAYTAAVKRGNEVLINFQQTEAVADALALLAFCYYQLELPELAQSNIALLKLNFPNHPTLTPQGKFIYGADYNLNYRSWLNRISLGYIDTTEPPLFDTRK